jgi:hypothetical protein
MKTLQLVVRRRTAAIHHLPGEIGFLIGYRLAPVLTVPGRR